MSEGSVMAHHRLRICLLADELLMMGLHEGGRVDHLGSKARKMAHGMPDDRLLVLVDHVCGVILQSLHRCVGSVMKMVVCGPVSTSLGTTHASSRSIGQGLLPVCASELLRHQGRIIIRISHGCRRHRILGVSPEAIRFCAVLA